MSSSTPHANFKPGFRDVRWGDPPTADMEVRSSDGAVKTMVRPSDRLQIGAARLTAISYTFFQDRLATVRLDVENGYATGASEVLTAAFGKPLGEGPSFMTWSCGASTPDATTVVAMDDPSDLGGWITISSYSGAREIEAYRAAKAAAVAQSDL